MDQAQIDTIAAELASARAGGCHVTPSFFGRFGPIDPATALAIQASVARALGPVGGWKIGRTEEDVTTLAPIFEALIHKSPASLDPSSFQRFGVECEVGFRLAEDLRPLAGGHTREGVAAAIHAICPVIELVDTRIGAEDEADAMWKLADFQINAGLVVGPETEDWQKIDRSDLVLGLEVAGETFKERRGPNPAGDPLDLLVLLANEVGDHCGGLKKGQVVITGSLTGLDWLAPASDVGMRLEGLGEVRIGWKNSASRA